MYEELVKSLRNCVADENGCCFRCPEDCNGPCQENLMTEAADAIEKLMKLANELLAKYEEEATTVIWEYSVHIDDSLDHLRKEIATYQANINGGAEPPKEET